MKNLKDKLVNESISELKIKNNPKKNTFDICNLIGDEYTLIKEALSEMKDKGADLLEKINNAEEL
jgi:5-bromo-4-chloroindolyl phosphate hydrolysis protein